jgi:choline dehydrogenase-like flavoprotein
MDASIMPMIISANTNATVMAVADKGVDLMIGAYTGRTAVARDHASARDGRGFSIAGARRSSIRLAQSNNE